MTYFHGSRLHSWRRCLTYKEGREGIQAGGDAVIERCMGGLIYVDTFYEDSLSTLPSRIELIPLVGFLSLSRSSCFFIYLFAELARYSLSCCTGRYQYSIHTQSST